MNFEQKYHNPPTWLKRKLSRRTLLKAAAGATAVAAAPAFTQVSASAWERFSAAITQGEWQTLDAVYQHVLPSSPSGPGAKEIQATFYLYQLVHEQPTAQAEIDFVYQGVGWLEGYTNKRYQQRFAELTNDEKEQVLQGISRSQAGTNWLNMLIVNLYEAMLAPPAYGGNPDGIGWQWLEHQMGFPLPEAGQRYYELPQRSSVRERGDNSQHIPIKQIGQNKKRFLKA